MNESRTSRRWFQLSLRSIFLLVLVVAAYFAGYRTALRQAEQAQQAEREALEAEREARLEAERSAAEAMLAKERFAYMQAVANAARTLADSSTTLKDPDAKLSPQEKEPGRQSKSEPLKRERD